MTPGVRRWSSRRSVYKAFGEVPPDQPVARQQITLNRQGIVVATSEAGMQADWVDVLELSRQGDHLFIFTNREQTVIVPRRAFPDETAFAAFFDAAICYRTLFLCHSERVL